MEAVTLAMLVDRGLLSYSDRVAKHWPAFGKGGKEQITVKNVLQHSAGLHTLNATVALETLTDIDAVARLIEDAAPSFPAHTAKCYHAYTRGLILNELVRRVDPQHRTIGEFIASEVSPRLGVEFFTKTPPGRPRTTLFRQPPDDAILRNAYPFVKFWLGLGPEPHPIQRGVLSAALDWNSRFWASLTSVATTFLSLVAKPQAWLL